MLPTLARNVLYTDADGTRYAAFISAVRDACSSPVGLVREEDTVEVFLAVLVHRLPDPKETPKERTIATLIEMFSNSSTSGVVFTKSPVVFARAPGVPGTWTWPPRA